AVGREFFAFGEEQLSRNTGSPRPGTPGRGAGGEGQYGQPFNSAPLMMHLILQHPSLARLKNLKSFQFELVSDFVLRISDFDRFIYASLAHSKAHRHYASSWANKR